MDEEDKQFNISKDEQLKFLCSLDRADREGLYFPRRRVRITDTKQQVILDRIENNDFKNTSEQEL